MPRVTLRFIQREGAPFILATATIMKGWALAASVINLKKIAVVVSSGGAPTPAGTSVFTKHNWDMGMGYLWLNGWGIYHLMGGAFMA